MSIHCYEINRYFNCENSVLYQHMYSSGEKILMLRLPRQPATVSTRSVPVPVCLVRHTNSVSPSLPFLETYKLYFIKQYPLSDKL